MSKGTTSYRIKDEEAMYYLTFATVEWIDVFTNKRYKDIVVDSLQYCQKEKGLTLFPVPAMLCMGVVFEL